MVFLPVGSACHVCESRGTRTKLRTRRNALPRASSFHDSSASPEVQPGLDPGCPPTLSYCLVFSNCLSFRCKSRFPKASDGDKDLTCARFIPRSLSQKCLLLFSTRSLLWDPTTASTARRNSLRATIPSLTVSNAVEWPKGMPLGGSARVGLNMQGEREVCGT